MSEQIRRVGPYILLEKLAAGGMAEVYLAKMVSSDKLVAVKKVLPDHANTADLMRLFRDEVKVSMNMAHGNIVSFIDCIEENGELYLVMEFVNGLNLRKLVGDLKFKKTKLSYPQTLFVISEVAAGLDYAHRSVDCVTNQKLNIIHRDVNPHNVMVTFDGCIKVIDFGIAKADSRTDTTKVGTIKGKFSYMSPEQASAGAIDFRTDVYALGIVMWELITGRRLRDGKNDLNTLKKIRTENVVAPREVDVRIPVELERIVMKALQRDPDERYQRISDFKFAIDSYMKGEFPDFRASDFTDFIGTIYAELIKSRIEKLVYFSKVKFGSDEKAPAVIIVNQDGKVKTGQSRIELPEGFVSKSAPAKKESINFALLNKENPFAAEVKFHTKQKASNFFNEARPAEEEGSPKKKFDIGFLGNFKHLALMGVVFYAGYSFYRQNLKTTANAASVSAPAVKTADGNDGSRVPANAEDQMAYVNINVENSQPSETKIYIDGKIVHKKFPIKMFAINSHQNVKVGAFNQRTRMFDEKIVMGRSGQPINVNLVLRPYHPR